MIRKGTPPFKITEDGLYIRLDEEKGVATSWYLHPAIVDQICIAWIDNGYRGLWIQKQQRQASQYTTQEIPEIPIVDNKGRKK